jgi:hypothetical protein
VHSDGGITTIARGTEPQSWKRIKNGVEIGDAPAPAKPKDTELDKFVRMGGGYDVSYDYGEVIVKLADGTEIGKGGLVPSNYGSLLELDIQVKFGENKVAKGEDVFNAIYDRIVKENNGDKDIIFGIKGRWFDGLPDNLNSFNEGIKKYVNNKQKTIEEVALNNTFTGIMAQRKGFKRVVSINGKQNPDGTFQYVTSIIFTK